MVWGMWVIFARIPVLIELHFAYGIYGRLLVLCFKCFHSEREGLHFFLWELLYSDFFNIRCDNRLDREQIFVLHWGRSEALCNKKGSQLAGRQLWGILTSLGISFRAGSDILEGEEGVAFLRGSTEYVEASSSVISGQHTFHENSVWVLCYYTMPGDTVISSLFQHL